MEEIPGPVEVLRALRSGSQPPPASSTLASLVGEPIGTGQMCDTVRLVLSWQPPDAGPASLVSKLPSSDEGSRSTAAAFGIYEREARFYAELAPRTTVPAPRCLGVLEVDGMPAALLEDLSGRGRQADQIAGIDVDCVPLAIDALARLHAPFWDDAELAAQPWLFRRCGVPLPHIQQHFGERWQRVLARFGALLEPDACAVVERFAARLDAWSQSIDGPFTLVHHDFRADNLLVGRDANGAPRLWVLDWQTVGWGSPGWDLAYFLGGSLSVETRRAIERDALAAYAERLRALGGPAVDADWLWARYRQLAFGGLLIAVNSAGAVKATERGDRMFATLINRHATQVLDHGALEWLP